MPFLLPSETKQKEEFLLPSEKPFTPIPQPDVEEFSRLVGMAEEEPLSLPESIRQTYARTEGWRRPIPKAEQAAYTYLREAQPAFKWVISGMPEDPDPEKFYKMSWPDVIRKSYPMLKNPDSRVARSVAAQFGVEVGGQLLDIGTRPSTYIVWGALERLVPPILQGAFKKLPKGWQQQLIKERYVWGRAPIDLAYKELGVKSGASFSEVHRAWLSQMTKWHPDKAPVGQALKYHQKVLRIQGAFDKIKVARGLEREANKIVKGLPRFAMGREGVAFAGGMPAGRMPYEATVKEIALAQKGIVSPPTLRAMEKVLRMKAMSLTAKEAIPMILEAGKTKPSEVKLPKQLRPEEAPPIKETVKQLEKELKPTPLPSAKIKPIVRKATGQVRVGNLVREDVALNRMLQREQAAAKKAFSEGRKEGVALHKKHIAEITERLKVRQEQRARTRKMIADINRLDLAKMSPQEAEPIKTLIRDFDLVKRQKPTMLKLAKTRDFLKEHPDAEMPDYVMDKLARLDKRNLNDITVDELETVHQSIMHYAHLNKVKNEIKVGREIRRASQVRFDSITEMKLPKEIKGDIVQSQKSKTGRLLETGRLIKDTFGIRHDHYDLVVESLAGKNSTMDKVLYQAPKEGVNKQLAYRQNVYKTFQKDLEIGNFLNKHKIKDISRWMNERVKIGKFNLTRGERMSLYRHTLNENNLRHILEGGFGFKHSKTPYRIYKVTEKELNNILVSLSPAEKEFAGKPVSNLFENQHKALNEVFYQKNNYPLPKEENYYPIEVMRTALPEKLEAESILEELKGKWVRIGLKKGMLKGRMKSRLPIYLNSIANDINKSVLNAAAYVGLEIPLSNASKLLYDRAFRAQLVNRYGIQTWKEIEKGLRDIAGDWQSYSTVEDLFLKVKNKLSTAILGLNPFVMTKQILSYALYSTYVKPEYLIRGFVNYIENPIAVSNKHKLYSPGYAERLEGGYSRDVADVFKSRAEKRLYKGKGAVPEKLMGGVKLFDKGAVIPGMEGATLQVLGEIKAGKFSKEVVDALNITAQGAQKLNPEAKMKLAYKFADYATERTQPMFSPEHRSSLSRGTPLEKLFTHFTSFTNQALNLTRRTWREALRTGDPKIYAKLAKVLFLLLIVNTGGVMMIDELRNYLYRRKEKKPLGKRYARAILDSTSSYFYFLRDLERSVMSKAEKGTFRGYDISIPVLEAGNTLADAFADGIGALTEDTDEKKRKRAAKFIDEALELILISQGIPYQTPKKIVKGVVGEEEKAKGFVLPSERGKQKTTKFILPSER